MKDPILDLEKKAIQELSAIHDLTGLERFRIAYLGKKGQVTAWMKKLAALPPEERPEAGKLANQVKTNLTKHFEAAKERIAAGKVVEKSLLDVTLPGRRPGKGGVHPITKVLQEICEIFVRMGFKVVEGPEVELDYYNFEALNIPKDHPARDMQDTFYVSPSVLLRTHTSPMEVRVMESQPPPVRIIAPGKVYRRDSDVTHTPMFHQVEGLLVDKGIAFSDLKGTLIRFVHQMFGHETSVRFRPSFFPFTEPSAEVDIQCVICGERDAELVPTRGGLKSSDQE
jgi:phenylalanyl-tRNA synthetase alpha chain